MTHEGFFDRPRTLKEVCHHYGVSYRTMQKMLHGAGLDYMVRRRGSGSYFFLPGQLRLIEQAFGVQTSLDLDTGEGEEA